MASSAKVILVGYLGSASSKDIVIKSTGEMKKVITFGLAINYKKENAEFVQWFNCDLFNTKFDVNWFEKGKQLYVEGNLIIEEYEDNKGIKQMSPKVYVDKVLFLGKKDD